MSALLILGFCLLIFLAGVATGAVLILRGPEPDEEELVEREKSLA